MLEYFKKIKNQIESIKTQIKNEKDNFKKIALEFNLKKLNDISDNFSHKIIENFNTQLLKDFSAQLFSNETISKAEEEAAKSNTKILNILVSQYYTPLQEKEEELNELLKRNPDCENEGFNGSADYVKAKGLRKSIERFKTFIAENRSKLAVFFDKLSSEDKDTLVEKLIENINLGKDSYENVFNSIKNYKSEYDFAKNQKCLVQKEFDILVKDENNKELANYLLENKENIDRLVSKADNDILVGINGQLTIKLGYEHANYRQSSFEEAARKNNVSNIIRDQGQFDNEKIYFVKEDYNSFVNCIKELKTSDKTKENIKMLLHEMDKLDIIHEHSSAAESDYKEYGFLKFLKVEQKFINEMKKENPSKEKIEEALNDLLKEEEKIKKMYDLIEKTLGDDFLSMPINVDSLRNVWVPVDFKDNIVINSKFNSLYIMLTFIKDNNLDIDEFVNNPIQQSIELFQKEVDKRNLDKVLKGKTKIEALLFLADDTKGLPRIDPYQYTRCIDMLQLSEENEENKLDNLLSISAIDTRNGVLNSIVTLKGLYFSSNYKETLQNIFLAKENEKGEIPYLDCYVCNKSLQEDMLTGFVADNRPTVLQQIAKDEDIVTTFYSAVNMLTKFAYEIKNVDENQQAIHPNEIFEALQEFSAKIAIAIDLNGKDRNGNRYPQQFIDDVNNVVKDYTKVAGLSDLNLVVNESNKNKLIKLMNDKDKIPQIKEKNILVKQKEYDDKFNKEFEKINKEIDKLDEKVTKIEKTLPKGETNKEIDDITIELLQKNNRIRELQNERIDSLRKDFEEGVISKFYFEKRVEQVMLLKDVNKVPALFLCDDKDYKNFSTYKKNVLKGKVTNVNEEKANYERLMKNSKEEKRLFLLTKVLADNDLGITKTENVNCIGNIEIIDKTQELKDFANELNFQNENKKSIVVDLKEDEAIIEENDIHMQSVLENNKQKDKENIV